MLATELTMHFIQNSSAFKWFSRTRTPMICMEDQVYTGFVEFTAGMGGMGIVLEKFHVPASVLSSVSHIFPGHRTPYKVVLPWLGSAWLRLGFRWLRQEMAQ